MAQTTVSVSSTLWGNPLVRQRIDLTDGGLSVVESILGLLSLEKHTFVPFERIESFEMERGRWTSRAILIARNPDEEYRMGPFPAGSLADFEESFRETLLKNAPRPDLEGHPVELPELAKEIARLAAGTDSQLCAMVDLVLSQGVHHRCSDIHFDPLEDGTMIRFRVDGMFHDVHSLSKSIEKQVMARIKVLARLISYETRVPQEGRISLKMEDRDVDLRVSLYPTLQGEKAAIRVFDSEGSRFDLAELGINESNVQQLRTLLGKPSGTILLTGPSGSGKTTTIYAALKETRKLHDLLTNVVTIEDPIEHRLPGIQQTEIFEPKGLTFLTALRAMLRQNADVIMVGEIRDSDTASVAVQAGLTGHLVISTIHAGTSARVLARLVEMGIEPFLIASSITAILAQRLPRKNCPYCMEEYTPSPEVLAEVHSLKEKGVAFPRGAGCRKCDGLGFIGRMPVAELMIVGEALEQYILEGAPVREIELAAREAGMKTMWEDGLDRVVEGTLSPDELVRVVPKAVSEWGG